MPGREYWSTMASLSRLTPSRYSCGERDWIACQSRSFPVPSGPASTVMARAVSWVEREFIAVFSAGAG